MKYWTLTHGNVAPKKQTRKRGRKKVEEEEPEPEPEPEQKSAQKPAQEPAQEQEAVGEQKEKTEEHIEPEPVVESTEKSAPPTKKSPTLPKHKASAIPTSPSKRVSSISSRIPSPVKKHSLTNSSKPDLDFRKTEHSIHQQFTSKNLPKLTQIIDDLKSSKAEHLFDELKNSTELRFKTSDDLINSLSSRNQQLSIELEELKGRLAEAESNSGASANVVSNEANEEESFRNELILDMMEQIVGLRIHNVEDTDEALSFDCSQSGKNGGEYANF